MESSQDGLRRVQLGKAMPDKGGCVHFRHAKDDIVHILSRELQVSTAVTV